MIISNPGMLVPPLMVDGVVNIQISFEANKKVHGRMFNLTFQPSAAIRKTEEAEEKLSQTSNQNVRFEMKAPTDVKHWRTIF